MAQHSPFVPFSLSEFSEGLYKTTAHQAPNTLVKTSSKPSSPPPRIPQPLHERPPNNDPTIQKKLRRHEPNQSIIRPFASLKPSKPGDLILRGAKNVDAGHTEPAYESAVALFCLHNLSFTNLPTRMSKWHTQHLMKL